MELRTSAEQDGYTGADVTITSLSSANEGRRRLRSGPTPHVASFLKKKIKADFAIFLPPRSILFVLFSA